ncbi:class A beta-lactamase BOR-1 [Niveibacterium umoris]
MQVAGIALAAFSTTASARKKKHQRHSRFEAIEDKMGGRLGVCCIDTASGRITGYREGERFPMCSTFKWLAAAALLHRVDAGEDSLERRIVISADDLMEWAPATKQHVGGEGMSLAALCEAAITESDNTAANLILREIGGIPMWNAYVRGIGDTLTRLDRGEPALNESRPGDVRDTTTPAAMAVNLRRLLLEDKLSAGSRAQLTQWMLATKYSGQRLRAGLPEGWRLADKTGTGDAATGTISDVGVYWNPAGKPIVVTAYLTEATVDRSAQEAVIADIGRWARTPAKGDARA